MNLISALISLISYAVGDIHISNQVFTNIEDVNNDSYYEFEINKNGEIQKMLFVVKGNVSVAPEVKTMDAGLHPRDTERLSRALSNKDFAIRPSK